MHAVPRVPQRMPLAETRVPPIGLSMVSSRIMRAATGGTFIESGPAAFGLQKRHWAVLWTVADEASEDIAWVSDWESSTVSPTGLLVAQVTPWVPHTSPAPMIVPPIGFVTVKATAGVDIHAHNPAAQIASSRTAEPAAATRDRTWYRRATRRALERNDDGRATIGSLARCRETSAASSAARRISLRGFLLERLHGDPVQVSLELTTQGRKICLASLRRLSAALSPRSLRRVLGGTGCSSRMMR